MCWSSIVTCAVRPVHRHRSAPEVDDDDDALWLATKWIDWLDWVVGCLLDIFPREKEEEEEASCAENFTILPSAVGIDSRHLRTFDGPRVESFPFEYQSVDFFCFSVLFCFILFFISDFPPPTERVGITKIKKEKEKRRKKWNCQKLSHSTLVTFHVHERYGANESVDAKSNHQVDAKTYRWCTSLIKYYPTYFRHFRFVSMSRTKCNKRFHVKLNFPSIGSKNCPISYRLHGTI